MRLHKAGVAARLLKVPPSTLRVYCRELKDVVSPWARGEKGRGVGGRGGGRRYTDGDLALLARARELLAAGRTYAQVRATLAGEETPSLNTQELWGGEEEEARGGGVEVSRAGERSSEEWGELLRLVMRVAEAAQRAADNWRELLEERNRQIALLTERVAELERRAGGKGAGGKWFGGGG